MQRLARTKDRTRVAGYRDILSQHKLPNDIWSSTVGNALLRYANMLFDLQAGFWRTTCISMTHALPHLSHRLLCRLGHVRLRAACCVGTPDNEHPAGTHVFGG